MPSSLLQNLQRRRTFLLWLFPIAVWAAATGFFGFDIGKYSDDWSQSLINPETGSADPSFHHWVRWPFFFRPLYFILVWAINTAFWEHDWVRHALAALAHLSVGVCLYRLLRRFGLGRPASIVPVSIMLACPIHYEAVLWVAAVGIPVGTALFLIAAERVIGFARQIPDRQPWGSLAVMGLTIFAAACFHEQPAAAAASLPALYLACCLPQQSILVRMRRAMLVGMFCGAGCIAYTALIIATAPPGRRGSVGSLITGEHAAERAASFGREIARWVVGDHARDAVIDAGVRGLHIVSGHASSLAFGIVLLGGGVGWLIAFPAGWSRTEGHSTTRRTGWLLVFSCVLAVASLVPIAMTAANGVYSRYFYVFSLGVPIACACLIDLAAGLRVQRTVRIVLPGLIAAATAGASLWGSLAMVSWQADYRARAAADRETGSQLRALMPAPARSAVLVPISIAPRAVFRDQRHAIPGALERPHAGWAFIQHLYGRADLSATHCRVGEPPPLGVVAGGLAYRYPDGWPIEVRDQWGRGIKGRVLIPWDQAVVFEIDAEGRVNVLLRAEVERRLGRR